MPPPALPPAPPPPSPPALTTCGEAGFMLRHVAHDRYLHTYSGGGLSQDWRPADQTPLVEWEGRREFARHALALTLLTEDVDVLAAIAVAAALLRLRRWCAPKAKPDADEAAAELLSDSS